MKQGGILNVAIAYSMGIMLALIVAAPTSGGHLAPAFTIAFTRELLLPFALSHSQSRSMSTDTELT